MCGVENGHIWQFTDSCFHCLHQGRIAVLVALVITALSYTNRQPDEWAHWHIHTILNQLLFTDTDMFYRMVLGGPNNTPPH